MLSSPLLTAPTLLSGFHVMETSVTSPQRGQSSTKGTLHKRTYQACIPCRQRKVRCDLGKVDDPDEPPCLRCRRESKECFFSATRGKRKTEDGLDRSNSVASRSNRRRTGQKQTAPVTQQNLLQPARNPEAVRSLFSIPPLDLETTQRHDYAEPVQDQEVTNETAAALFQTPINTPEDALHLLLKASSHSKDLEFHNTPEQGNPQSPLDKKPRNGSDNYQFARPAPIEPVIDRDHLANIDPAIASGGSNNVLSNDSSLEALRIWSRLRFVRAGWLTAREAISYINYFYENLSPLTPISPPDFRLSSTHARLFNEEPILTVTILTIAARYKILAGPGGQTRSFMIHDRLWIYLQNMITRMFWGQEQFGGGFCGAGPRKVTQKGGLRSLGTIESLLLLSEFHPRSMHFPPGDDADEIFAPTDGDMTVDETQERYFIGKSTFAGWTEPALRSDRMCWSLIGTAYTLAYELGIFGKYADGIRSLDGGNRRRSDHFEICQRADRIERLLYIYVTQTSGRLGFPSAFHHSISDTNLASVQEVFVMGDQSISRDPVEIVQQSWLELTSIMKACNATLFCSKEKTTELIKSEEYIGLVQQLQPVLASWKQRFQGLDVPKYSRIILSIEFEYGRIYTNSLGLQAVLDHWTTNGGQDGAPAAKSLVTLYKRNEISIREVIDASRSLLRYIVEGLEDNLKHAPVRTHMRILSGAMFLLKTFALGAREDEVAASLKLLDATIEALRKSVVDDVHLCLRIADLLEGLTKSIRDKFIRLAARPSKHAPALSVQQKQTGNPRETSSSYIANIEVPSSYHSNRIGNLQDGLAGISTDRADFRDNGFTIMPPRDTAYSFISSSNSTCGSYDYQSQQLHAATPSISDEDWWTLDLNPLLSDTVTGGVGTAWGDQVEWFANFGPEIRDNLEVLGKLVNEQYRVGEAVDDGGAAAGSRPGL